MKEKTDLDGVKFVAKQLVMVDAKANGVKKIVMHSTNRVAGTLNQ